jgi:Arc/MetJ family transcription regulator
MGVTRTLIEIDDSLLDRAAARLGTTTKKDTVNRALELAAVGSSADDEEQRQFREFADRTAARMAEIDWDAAWH